MSGLVEHPAKPNALTLFCVLAFSISWSGWVPATLASHGLLPGPANPALGSLVGAMGPTLAALLTTALYDGRPGFGALLRRLLTWRVGLRWYAFVLLWPAALSLVATGLSVGLGSAWPNFAQPPFGQVFAALPAGPMGAGVVVFLPAIFLQQLLFGSAMGEELGWRGYALPRLQFGGHSLKASLQLGLLWGVWHLPLWLTQGNAAQEAHLGWHFVELVATTVLFTWVYNHTRGSLLLALLFHAAIGVTPLFLASVERHPAIVPGLAWMAAALVIAGNGLRRPAGDSFP